MEETQVILSDLILFLSKLSPEELEKSTALEVVNGWFEVQHFNALVEDQEIDIFSIAGRVNEIH